MGESEMAKSDLQEYMGGTVYKDCTRNLVQLWPLHIPNNIAKLETMHEKTIKWSLETLNRLF